MDDSDILFVKGNPLYFYPKNKNQKLVRKNKGKLEKQKIIEIDMSKQW